jgi:NAD(P)-dependent dehydrogenase (short-subunit alcohol dehydrogenase family)
MGIHKSPIKQWEHKHKWIYSGASSGIGQDAAVEFAKEGATVVIHGQNPQKLDVRIKKIILSIFTCFSFVDDGEANFGRWCAIRANFEGSRLNGGARHAGQDCESNAG